MEWGFTPLKLSLDFVLNKQHKNKYHLSTGSPIFRKGERTADKVDMQARNKDKYNPELRDKAIETE